MESDRTDFYLFYLAVASHGYLFYPCTAVFERHPQEPGLLCAGRFDLVSSGFGLREGSGKGFPIAVVPGKFDLEIGCFLIGQPKLDLFYPIKIFHVQ